MIKKIIRSYATLSYRKKILDGEFENRTAIIGSAVFPTFALFNHSCDSNTYKYFVGNKLVVVASKVGKKKKNQILVLLIQEYSTWTRSYRELLSQLPSVPATWKAVLAQRSLPVRIDLALNLTNDDWFG